jgi:hypothetical protein
MIADDEFIQIFPHTDNRTMAILADMSITRLIIRARRLGVWKDPTYIAAQHAGKNAPNWTGGLRRNIKTNARYRTWRAAVLKRDDYTCQRCAYRRKDGSYLHAHHIQPWSTCHDLRYDVANGQTLCAACHWALHGFTPRQAYIRQSCGCGCGELASFGKRYLKGHGSKGRVFATFTEAQRQAQRERFKGRTHTRETRAKLSATLSGRVRGEAHCHAISAAKKGTVISPEHRAKIGAHLKGRKIGPISEEKRARLAQAKHAHAARTGVYERYERILAWIKEGKTTREMAALLACTVPRAQEQRKLARLYAKRVGSMTCVAISPPRLS